MGDSQLRMWIDLSDFSEEEKNEAVDILKNYVIHCNCEWARKLMEDIEPNKWVEVSIDKEDEKRQMCKSCLKNIYDFVMLQECSIMPCLSMYCLKKEFLPRFSHKKYTIYDEQMEWTGSTYFKFVIENRQIISSSSICLDEEDGDRVSSFEQVKNLSFDNHDDE